MCIYSSKNKVYWQRKVKYPQPHTKYLCNTLEYLLRSKNKYETNSSVNKSLNQQDSDILYSLLGYIERNLRIKQAFLNFILILINNFLAFSNSSVYLKSKYLFSKMEVFIKL